MKKIISLVLVMVFLFSFAGCNKKKSQEDSGSVDFEYYAKLGQIPECSYALGQSVDKLNEELKSESENNADEEFVYNVTEGEKNVLIDNGTFLYYYVKANKDKGISYIVDFDKAFGFDTGTVSIEVKNALSEFECTEEKINENNSFFLFGITNGSILKYTINDHVILFVFEDNALCATAIYDPSNWT